jgi:hypothetical protein
MSDGGKPGPPGFAPERTPFLVSQGRGGPGAGSPGENLNRAGSVFLSAREGQAHSPGHRLLGPQSHRCSTTAKVS